MPDYKFTYQGKEHVMPWTGSVTPSRDDLVKFATSDQSEPDKSLWDKTVSLATDPLIEAPGRWGKQAGDVIAEKFPSKLGQIASAGVESLGSTVSDLTSPLNLGLFAVSGGLGKLAGSAAAKIGTTEVAEKTLFAARMLKNAKETERLVKEVNTARELAGRARAAAGAYRVGQAGLGAVSIPGAVQSAREGHYPEAVAQLALGAAIAVPGIGGMRRLPQVNRNIEPMPDPISQRLMLNAGSEVPKQLTSGAGRPDIEIPSWAKVSEKSVDPRFYASPEGNIGDARAKYPMDVLPESNVSPFSDLPIDPATMKFENPNGPDFKWGYHTATPGSDVGQVVNLPAMVAARYNYNPFRGIQDTTIPGLPGGALEIPAQGRVMRTPAPLIDLVRDARGKMPGSPSYTETYGYVEPPLNPQPTVEYGPKQYSPYKQNPLSESELMNVDLARGEMASRRSNNSLRRPVDAPLPELAPAYPGKTPFDKKIKKVIDKPADITPTVADPNLRETFMPSFTKWVNKRHAAQIEASYRARDFAEFDKQYKSMSDFAREYQRNPNANDMFRRLKTELDADFGKIKSVDADIWFKKSYLPQLWKEKRADVVKALGMDDPNSNYSKRIGTKPFFTLNSVLKTYEEGIAKGLHPAFESVSDMLYYHKHAVERFLADKEFVSNARSSGWIKPINEVPRGDSSFRSLTATSPEFFGQTAPKELADLINNYVTPLKERSSKFLSGLQTFGDINNLTKNFYLSSGVPGTTLNMHGHNIGRRNFMARGLGGIKDYTKDIVGGQKRWAETSKADHAEIVNAVEHGYMASGIEEYSFGGKAHESVLTKQMSGNRAGRAVNAGLNVQGKAFEDPLFRGALPRAKWEFYKERKADLISKGQTADQAATNASEQANIMYGGINTEAAGRDRVAQGIFRSLALAPDWMETNYQLAKKTGKSIVGKEDPFYKKAALRAGLLRVPQLLAAVAAGEQAFGEKNSTAIPLGTTASGKQRQLPAFGTAVEYQRLPEDILGSAIRGDVNRAGRIGLNRMAAIPRAGLSYFTNSDRFGNPLSGNDRFGNPISAGRGVLNNAINIATPLVPPYVAALVNYYLRNWGGEESLMGGLEGPVQYQSKPKENKGKAKF